MPGNTILQTRAITKSFSGTVVLNKVDLDIRAGEIFGLIGENGAGKSTLIKIVSGIYQPSSGSLVLDGAEVAIRDASAAKRLGIATVPQEFNLVDTMRVYENIFLGGELRTRIGLLARESMRERSRELLGRLKTDISVDAPISALSVAEKQMVEVAKAISHDAKILIFDEPTTTLTQNEISILFELMSRLRQDGVTMIFVSHKLKEVKTICDRVAVLRDGNLISVDPVDEIEEAQMAQRMVGRELLALGRETAHAISNEPVLEVRDLNVPGQLSRINLRLNKGEILGLAGLVGAGRTELAETIMGLRETSSGEIWIRNKRVEVRDPRVAVRHKIGYISEDRQGRGVHLIFPIPNNVTLISLKRYLRPFIDTRKEAEATAGYVEKFDIRAASMRSELRFLSGGNQQKVYLSKWMDTNPEILILDEPTRGIDVSAKREIYLFIRDLAGQGYSIIVISSELEEILTLCSRVYVLREGTITGELSGEHINEEEIMFYATGVKAMGDSA